MTIASRVCPGNLDSTQVGGVHWPHATVKHPDCPEEHVLDMTAVCTHSASPFTQKSYTAQAAVEKARKEHTDLVTSPASFVSV